MGLPADGNLSIKLAEGSSRSIAQEVDGNTTGNKSLATLGASAGGKTKMSEFYSYSSVSAPDASPPIDFALDFYNDNDPTSGFGAYYLIWTNYTSWAPGAEPTVIWIQRRENSDAWANWYGLSWNPSTESQYAVVSCSSNSYTWRAYYWNSAGQSAYSSISSPQVANC